MKLYFLLFLPFIGQPALFSKAVINEIILENDSTIVFELFNNSNSTVKILSFEIQSPELSCSAEFENQFISPFDISMIEFHLVIHKQELSKLVITIETEKEVSTTSFNGYLLSGESAGRYPDINGEFIISDISCATPGKGNRYPGLLFKKTSKTKFSPRDSSPNACLYYQGYYWILGGWDYNDSLDTWSSKVNVWKSNDALDWTLVNDNPPFSHYSNYVVYNHKMMVYTGDTVFISTDGVSWERHLCHAFYYENYRFVNFNGKLLVFSFDNVYVSVDGINWDKLKTDLPWSDVRYLPAIVSSNDKIWMYGGYGFNDIWSSTDGLHWTKILDNAPWSKRIWFNFAYYDGKLWMIGGNDESGMDSSEHGNLRDFWYSKDGSDWKELKIDTSYSYRHAPFLWNDGKRLLLSSGFGNGERERMYNDVWELSVKDLYLIPDSADKHKVLSIFPDEPVNYVPENTDSVNIHINASSFDFHANDQEWLTKKIFVGNSIDSANVIFSDAETYNLGSWRVNPSGKVEFNYFALLNENPDWEIGSSLSLKNIYKSSEFFNINKAYFLNIENSYLTLSGLPSAINTVIKSSKIVGETNGGTVFRSNIIEMSGITSDDLWLTNYDNEKLLIKNDDEFSCIPDLIIKDHNIEFDKNSHRLRLRKIRFLENIVLTDKLDINPDAKIYLSGKEFSDRVFENFSSIPDNFELEDKAILTTELSLDLSNVTFNNNGVLNIGPNEIIFKNYLESNSQGIITIDPDGAIRSGLSNEETGKEIRLTFAGDPEFQHTIAVKISDASNNESQFRFQVKNTDEILPFAINDYNIEYFDKSVGIELITEPKGSVYKLSMGLLDSLSNPIYDYKFIFDAENLRSYTVEPADSMYIFNHDFRFRHKKLYSLYSDVDKNNGNNIIFPNPNEGIFHILDIGQFSLGIYNTSGQLLFQESFADEYLLFEKDLSNVLKSDGIYFVVITKPGTAERFTQKIIVKHRPRLNGI